MAAPVRGTQSFVAVMSQVWRSPSLSALEVLWRWVTGALLLLAALRVFRTSLPELDLRLPLLATVSVFQPATSIHNIDTVLGELWLGAGPVLSWLAPGVFLLWNFFAAFGRTLVLRRLSPQITDRPMTLLLLGTLRALLLAAAWTLWFLGLAYAARTAITLPASRNQEPSVVLFAAMLICGTLFLYVAWGVFSWFLQLAPLLAMRLNLGPIAALRVALGSGGDLRGKLIEINLVMHIVRLCLIVLAMVFSATPLPFSDVTTPTFLALWWSGVGLLYLAFSDYFHVVRSAAYLSLHAALAPGLPAPDAAVPAS